MSAAPLMAHIWDRHPDDWYVEPEWCSLRLFEEIEFEGDVCDPACGRGHIINSALALGFRAFGMDIERRSSLERFEQRDFLADDPRCWDNIVSNPPFGLCNGVPPRFVELALQRARHRLALLLPSKWMQSDKRAAWLAGTPLEFICPLTPRPSMPPGPVIEAGVKAGGGKVDFAWFVWSIGYQGEPRVRWIRRQR